MLDFKRINRHAECIKSPKITTLSFEGKIGDLPSTVKVKWMNSRPSLKQHRCLCRQLSVSSLVCVTFDRAVAPGQIRIFRAALQKWSRSTCSSLLQYRSNGAQDITLGYIIRLEWVQRFVMGLDLRRMFLLIQKCKMHFTVNHRWEKSGLTQKLLKSGQEKTLAG